MASNNRCFRLQILWAKRINGSFNMESAQENGFTGSEHTIDTD